MKNPHSHPAWMIDQLVEALNEMRDAWTKAALELRDMQFELDTTERQEALERAKNIVRHLK